MPVGVRRRPRASMAARRGSRRATWLTPRAVRVEACAVCDLCETLLGIDARIYEDMSVVLLGSDGRWRRFEPPPRPSPIRRLVHRLRQALARLIR